MQRSHFLQQPLSTRLVRILGPVLLGTAMLGKQRALAQTPEATPGASPMASPGADTVSAQEALVRFSEIEVSRDAWSLVHAFHPDSLNESPGYVIAGWYRDNVFPKGPHVAELTGAIEQVPDWTWPVTGEQYAAVEVGFHQIFDDGDELEDTAVMVPGPAGDFGPYLRFFGDSRGFIDAQVKVYYDKLLAGAFQTDFQLLSFPRQEVDLATVLPATWEDFEQTEHGTVENVEAGQWIRYARNEAAGNHTPTEEIQLSWVRVATPDVEPTAFDYALRAPVRFETNPRGIDLGLLREPDISLLTTMADNSYVQVQIPEHPKRAGVVTERLVFMVLDGASTWFTMVQAAHTAMEGNVANRFASSLPYIAV
jgi:hypothetical protein